MLHLHKENAPDSAAAKRTKKQAKSLKSLKGNAPTLGTVIHDFELTAAKQAREISQQSRSDLTSLLSKGEKSFH